MPVPFCFADFWILSIENGKISPKSKNATPIGVVFVCTLFS